MSIFDILPKGIVTYIITLIPAIAYVVKLTIDNWGSTNLEKIRLSNFKKFQIALTKYMFIGIAFVAVMYLILILSDQFKNIDDERIIYGVLVVCFIIFIAATFIAEKFLLFIGSILSFHYDYYIVNEIGKPVYRIIKLSSNNSLLVESDGIEEFLDSKENRRYKKVRREIEYLNKIYNSPKIKWYISGVTLLGVGSLIGVFFTEPWLLFGLYLLGVFLLLIALILILNYLENEKYKKENPTTNNEINPN